MLDLYPIQAQSFYRTNPFPCMLCREIHQHFPIVLQFFYLQTKQTLCMWMNQMFGMWSNFCIHFFIYCIYYSEYHLVPSLENIESIYEALCQGQSMNPDEDAMDAEPEEPINLNNFVWADGYGPDFLTGGVHVGESGDGAVPNMQNLNVSFTKHKLFNR